MNNEKINHPFEVPDHFFDDFRSEMIKKLENEPQHQKRKSIVLLVAKYAAIIVFSFVLGRLSTTYFSEKKIKVSDQEIYNVETVLSQVSDDEITDYLIENVSEDFLQ